MSALPKSLIEALSSRDVIPFVGAGVSLTVSDAAGAPFFSSWSELLTRAAERLRGDQNRTRANAVDPLVADSDFLPAAEKARGALGPHWFKFLTEQLNPSFEHAQRKAWN